MKYQITILFILIFLILNFNFSESKQPLTVDQIPNPKVDFVQCGYEGGDDQANRVICDTDNYLTHSEKKELNSKIQELVHDFKIPKCELESEIAIVLISKMVNPFYETLDNTAKRYAKALHDKYGVGKVECNNGMLMFLAIEDRKVYISTGSGMKKSYHRQRHFGNNWENETISKKCKLFWCN